MKYTIVRQVAKSWKDISRLNMVLSLSAFYLVKIF